MCFDIAICDIKLCSWVMGAFTAESISFEVRSSRGQRCWQGRRLRRRVPSRGAKEAGS